MPRQRAVPLARGVATDSARTDSSAPMASVAERHCPKVAPLLDRPCAAYLVRTRRQTGPTAAVAATPAPLVRRVWVERASRPMADVFQVVRVLRADLAVVASVRVEPARAGRRVTPEAACLLVVARAALVEWTPVVPARVAPVRAGRHAVPAVARRPLRPARAECAESPLGCS